MQPSLILQTGQRPVTQRDLHMSSFQTMARPKYHDELQHTGMMSKSNTGVERAAIAPLESAILRAATRGWQARDCGSGIPQHCCLSFCLRKEPLSYIKVFFSPSHNV